MHMGLDQDNPYKYVLTLLMDIRSKAVCSKSFETDKCELHGITNHNEHSSTFYIRLVEISRKIHTDATEIALIPKHKMETI